MLNEREEVIKEKEFMKTENFKLTNEIQAVRDQVEKFEEVRMEYEQKVSEAKIHSSTDKELIDGFKQEIETLKE